MGEIVDLEPVETVEMSPSEFLNLPQEERSKFSSFSIFPPRLGDDGFGSIAGKLRVPEYRVPVVEW